MAVAADPERFPLTRAAYEAMARDGVFDDARVELLYGRIVPMSPMGGPHVYCVTRLALLLPAALANRATVRVQAPLVAPKESLPEPDLAVVPLGDYLDEHPHGAHLVIEVADSSIARDRAKARLYAAAGVHEYWIVHLAKERVEVHREPAADGYAAVTRHAREATLTPLDFPDLTIAVGDVLPPAR